MAKATKLTYEVTTQNQDGDVSVQTADDVAADDVPKKGDSFEYEHREVRVAQVTKVVEIDADGNCKELTELGDTHHALTVPVEDEAVDVTDIDDPTDDSLATAQVSEK